MNPPARHDLARLRAALDYPEPPGDPDVPTILARGRRARARRRLLSSAATASAAVALVTAVAVLVPAGPPVAAPDRAVLSALSGGPAPAVLVAHGAATDEAPASFDPLTRTLDVGWVPDALDGGAVTVGTRAQTYSAVDDAYVNGGPDIGLVITVLSRGQEVGELPTGALGLPRGAVPRPTDPVRGGTAECLSDPSVATGTCTALRWEYAPGAWAQVSYAGTAGPTPDSAAAVTRRVAESVTLTAAEPVRLPFTLTGRLGGLSPLSTSVRVSDDVDPIEGTRWTAGVDLAPSDPAAPVLRVRSSWTPGGGTPGSDKYGVPNTVVDGHPAVLDDHGSGLVVWDVRGSTVSIFDAPDPVAAFRDVDVVDDPTDPTGWAAVR